MRHQHEQSRALSCSSSLMERRSPSLLFWGRFTALERTLSMQQQWLRVSSLIGNAIIKWNTIILSQCNCNLVIWRPNPGHLDFQRSAEQTLQLFNYEKVAFILLTLSWEYLFPRHTWSPALGTEMLWRDGNTSKRAFFYHSQAEEGKQVVDRAYRRVQKGL